MKSIKRVNIIDVPISAVNMESCIRSIFRDFDQVRGKYICVSNVHTTVMAHDDPSYYKVQSESFLSVPDGKPLSIIGRKTYKRMDRVTGPDLMRHILQKPGLRHFFYGNTEENLQSMLKEIGKAYPDAVIAGHEASVFREMTTEEEEALAVRMNQTKPDIIWVALGAPRQEFFCKRMEGRVNALLIGVGGAFNILAGITPEAPKWMQKISMEWFYRFLQEPGRLWKRYAVTNTKFLYYWMFQKPRRIA